MAQHRKGAEEGQVVQEHVRVVVMARAGRPSEVIAARKRHVVEVRPLAFPRSVVFLRKGLLEVPASRERRRGESRGLATNEDRGLPLDAASYSSTHIFLYVPSAECPPQCPEI